MHDLLGVMADRNVTWMVRWMILLATTFIIIGGEDVPHTESSLDVATCAVDDDGRNPQLDNTLKKGHKFLKKLINALEYNNNDYNVCGKDSRKFIESMGTLLANCPDMHHAIHAHWRHVIDYVNCVCTDKKPECQKSYDCLFEEYASSLVMRCDELYEFNIAQRTQSKCHFLRENVNCKDALITSKCGNLTGTFAYHALRLHNDAFLRENECHLPREPSYQGFRYTDNNGKCMDFYQKLQHCVSGSISRNKMLQFRSDNDMIVERRNSKANIRKACRFFETFKSCMEPVEQACRRGVEHVYEIDDDLRQYALKMEFICENKKVYVDNVRCYNDIHNDGTIEQCNNNVWDDVIEFLENVTSHDLHCRTSIPAVQGLLRELNKVGMCYKEIAQEKCSEEAGDTLYEFISLILKDPAYLRLDYKPNCQLHASSTTTASPPHVSTSPTRRRHTTGIKTHPLRSTRRREFVTESPKRTESSAHARQLEPKPVTPGHGKRETNIGGVSHSHRHRSSVFSLLVTLLYVLLVASTYNDDVL